MLAAGCAALIPEVDHDENFYDQQDAKAQERAQRQIADHGDIQLGMEMKDVMDSWGEPREIQNAGDSSSGNQKWIYYEGLSSPWSMSRAREIYFEDGKVAGWRSIAAH